MTEVMKNIICKRRQVILTTFLFIAFAAIGTLLAQNSMHDPFTIKIGTKYEVLKVGQPVTVYVVLANTSDRLLKLPVADYSDYRVTVWNDNGTDVSDTAKARELLNKKQPLHNLSNFVSGISPNKYIVDFIDVSYLKDMAAPGQYTVQVERSIPVELGYGVVKSNTITVTVTE